MANPLVVNEYSLTATFSEKREKLLQSRIKKLPFGQWANESCIEIFNDAQFFAVYLSEQYEISVSS